MAESTFGQKGTTGTWAGMINERPNMNKNRNSVVDVNKEGKVRLICIACRTEVKRIKGRRVACECHETDWKTHDLLYPDQWRRLTEVTFHEEFHRPMSAGKKRCVMIPHWDKKDKHCPHTGYAFYAFGELYLVSRVTKDELSDIIKLLYKRCGFRSPETMKKFIIKKEGLEHAGLAKREKAMAEGRYVLHFVGATNEYERLSPFYGKSGHLS